MLDYVILATSVLAVAYAALQARLLRHSNNATLYRSLVETSFQFESIFIESPELRKFVYGNVALPSAESVEGQRVRSLLDIALLNADLIRSQHKFIPRDARTYWVQYAKGIMKSSAAAAYIAENPELYSTSLVEEL